MEFHMRKQRYIDGFSQVHFIGGMVRIDTRKQNQPPRN